MSRSVLVQEVWKDTLSKEQSKGKGTETSKSEVLWGKGEGSKLSSAESQIDGQKWKIARPTSEAVLLSA